MRITNRIIQNNNLSNINTNKTYQDTLSTQMSTQKKISRPSEDPVVAIRALRLRTNVTEITQYYSKNIPDAESWLSVTEDALDNLSSVLTEMIKQTTTGANGELTSSNRQIVLEQLKALSEEVYSTGDVDYAGRYVFTGYRTDTSLSFRAPETKLYTITEQLGTDAIDQITKVNTADLLDINETNYSTFTTDETAVSTATAYRIRLAYNNCDSIDLNNPASQQVIPSIRYIDPTTGSPVDMEVTTVMHSYEQNPDPYTFASQNEDEVVYIPETGELLLGEKQYAKLMAVKDDPTTKTNEAELQVTYQKSDWLTNDLRPEHYFYCETEDLVYNESYLDGTSEKQVIEYDVGFNQKIRVNSTADECFTHDIGREVDDLIESLQQVVDLEKLVARLEGLQKDPTADQAKVQTELDAANKALTLAMDKNQRLFERGITRLQGYLNATSLSITDCGTRSKKLELIENRMQSQKTTFETLKSENEDVDITEVAINLSSAELTYEAALMATAKIAQTSLLNYI